MLSFSRARIYNGCPYTGDIFTFKISFTAHMIFFFTLKKMKIKYLAFEFSLTEFLRVIFTDRVLSASSFTLFLLFLFYFFCSLLTRSCLATVGASGTAARVAAHWRSSSLVVVVCAGTAPPL
jgi:hypothetical protein